MLLKPTSLFIYVALCNVFVLCNGELVHLWTEDKLNVVYSLITVLKGVNPWQKWGGDEGFVIMAQM